MRISETIETRVKAYHSMELHDPAHKFVSLRIAQFARMVPGNRIFSQPASHP